MVKRICLVGVSVRLSSWNSETPEYFEVLHAPTPSDSQRSPAHLHPLPALAGEIQACSNRHPSEEMSICVPIFTVGSTKRCISFPL